MKLYAPHENANIIRILPPTWPDAEHYGLDIHVHYGIGADRHSYLCLHKMKGEACPICEERERAQRDGDEEWAQELKPSRRVLVYLLDRSKEKEGVQAWAAPWTVDESLIKASTDRRSGAVLPIDDPEDGYDVEFDKTGKGLTTKYVGMSVARRASRLDNEEALDFVQEFPLPDMLKFYDYDHIQRAFNGGAGMAKDKDKGKQAGGDRDSRRDRDDDRGGRGRDRDRSDRDRDRDDDRDSDKDSDRSSRRGQARDDDEPTWDSVHSMNYDELCALVDTMKIDVDPDKSKSDEDLADWICEELKLEKTEERSSGRDRLARLRGG